MNFTFKERLKSFCEKYQIKVLGDGKRHPIFRVNEFFKEPKNSNIIDSTEILGTEPLLTLDIPLSKLENLADLDAIYYNQEYGVGHRRTFESWMDQQVEEKWLRDKYPQVQRAFEQYSMLLNLCREKPKTFPDLD
jgi:hypothetical protein